ncbi:MAG: hypothetical protein ACI3YD_08225, partial [Alloprevotella sp.]
INDNEGLAEGLNDFSAGKYAYIEGGRVVRLLPFCSLCWRVFPRPPRPSRYIFISGIKSQEKNRRICHVNKSFLNGNYGWPAF